MKLYVRERQKIGEGVEEPRFRVMAVVSQDKDVGKSVKLEGTHFRKVEIETIAQDLGAEIQYLKPMPEEERGSKKE